jgi:hypothetical protein
LPGGGEGDGILHRHGRDAALTDEEKAANDTTMICVSRAVRDDPADTAADARTEATW